jgi:hypothetical protein
MDTGFCGYAQDDTRSMMRKMGLCQQPEANIIRPNIICPYTLYPETCILYPVP